MCGIAGLIHKGKSSSVGFEMTQMLQALKHRGPDSTGYAVYGNEVNDLVMRLKIAEAEDMQRGSGIYAELDRRINQVDSFIDEHGVKVTKKDKINDYSYRYEFSFNGDLGKLAEHIEEAIVFLCFCIQSDQKPYKTCAFCISLLKILKNHWFSFVL